jgi:tetrahydromethanopterin S-methyltransferase subunit F
MSAALLIVQQMNKHEIRRIEKGRESIKATLLQRDRILKSGVQVCYRKMLSFATNKQRNELKLQKTMN